MSTDFVITTAHNEARLEGTRTFLDSGIDTAEIHIYGGTRRATPYDSPGSPRLVAIPLEKPCGTVDTNKLTLQALEDYVALVENTGTATWAAFVTASGAPAGDCNVAAADDDEADASVRLDQVTLYEGGTVALISAEMT